MEQLIHAFIQTKQDKPKNVNELLDFLQACYIRGEIAPARYRQLLKQLEERGAKKPDCSSEEELLAI